MNTLTIPFIEELESMSQNEFDAAICEKGSQGTVGCVNWPGEYPYKPSCAFSIAHSHDFLAIRFDVEGADLRATAMQDNGASWEDSCCELFISPDGKEYFNIETTCIGSVLMAHGTSRHGREKLPADQVAKVIRRSSLPHKAVEITGGTHRWQISVLVPFSLLGMDPDNLPERVRGNIYKCGDLTATPHFLSWNPIGTEHPDFHCPEYFGEFILEH